MQKLLLAWNAHCNVQRVVNAAWSLYLLKYAMKAEPKGNPHVTPDIAAGLNLKDLKPHQAQAAAALWMVQPVSPCEQALILLGIPLVQRSRKVHSISSRPPQQRTYTVSKSNTVCRSSIDKYTCRPEALEEVTFYE